MQTSLPTTMRALRVDQAGGDFLDVQLDPPQPAAGEVLVRLRASGVNPLDTKIRAGQAGHAKQPLPAVLGIDGAGVVERLGPGVTGWLPGDEVYGMLGGIGGLQGTLAEFIAVDARLLARKPARLGLREAAALPLAAITAWEGLVDRAAVAPGQSVLVQGGAGGVGHVAVQLARARGARVFATAAADDFEAVRSWARLRSISGARASRTTSPATPAAPASTSSSTRSAGRCWMPRSRRFAATAAMSSASSAGAATAWRRCPSARPLIPASSRCCPC